MSIFRRRSVGEGKLNPLELYFDTVGGENKTLVRFDFDTINVATGNFSEANKISQLSFDWYFYKGKLETGQDIGISGPYSSNFENEFCKNEASILVKLEHENLAQLLGYCIHGTKVFLVYDFALYASLDWLIFDPMCSLLDWDKRYKIILGVASALLYLHKNAPVWIIHCNVKPESILLDESFVPKLSSFMTANSLEINETYCYPGRIYGPRRYIAPEYYMSGNTSTKVDVYSFGVSVLEILTGDKAEKWLIERVRRNWLEEAYSNIMDPRINVDLRSMRRLVEIGLLCVQAEADRPSMEDVVGMLLGSSYDIGDYRDRARVLMTKSK